MMQVQVTLITTGASLQRKLSDAHLKGISIGMQLMEKREQDIEHGHQRGQSSLDRRTQAMMHVLEATDNGNHRQSGFHTHTFIPGAFLTPFEMVGNARRATKAQIGQHNALVVQAFEQGMEVLIMGVHGGPIPSDDLALIVERPAQLNPHTPASFVFALLAHLPGTAALADGKEPFDGIPIKNGKETGLSQESTKPVLMGLQLPLQSRAIGQAVKCGQGFSTNSGFGTARSAGSWMVG